jgi:hypothetical protein
MNFRFANLRFARDWHDAVNRKDHDETTPPEPQPSLQSEKPVLGLDPGMALAAMASAV